MAYLLVGYQVIRSAIQSISSGNVFNGFLPIGIATTGAFALGQHVEGVAVSDQCAGCFPVANEVKKDAAQAVR